MPETSLNDVRAASMQIYQQSQTIDSYYRQAAAAIWFEAAPSGTLHDHIEEALDAHQSRGYPLSGHTMVHLASRSLHDYALTHTSELDFAYPEDFGPGIGAIEPWRWLARVAVNNEQFRKSLTRRTINSTLPERTRGLEVAAACFPERFAGAHALDIGSNLNYLQRCLALPGLRTALGLHLVGKNSEAEDYKLTDRLIDHLGSNPLTNRPIIGDSLGVDLSVCEHPSIINWVMHCSITPKELVKDPHREETLLGHIESPSALVHFTMGDIFELGPKTMYPERFVGALALHEMTDRARFRFDIATALTVGYLFDDEKRRALVDRMLELTTDNGLLFIQDFCRVDPHGEPKYNISYVDDIYSQPWQYRLLVYDKQNPDDGWQEMMVYRTGRCQQARLGNGQLVYRDRLMSLSERLAQPIAW